MADRKFSQDMAGAWGLMRQKEKVLMILQSILTAILLIFLIIDLGMGMNKGWMLKTELGIVIVLFVLNALKAYPERKKEHYDDYVLLTLAAVVCFVLQFI